MIRILFLILVLYACSKEKQAYNNIVDFGAVPGDTAFVSGNIGWFWRKKFFKKTEGHIGCYMKKSSSESSMPKIQVIYGHNMERMLASRTAEP